MLRTVEEGKSLLRSGGKSLAKDCDDALLWTCDVLRGGDPTRSYEALVPWDVLISLVVIGFFGAFGMLIPFLLLRIFYGS